MMPVRLCFENKKFYDLVTQRNKITAVALDSDFVHLILMVHCLFTFHYANKYNIWRFKKNLAKLPNPKIARNETLSIHLLNKSRLLLPKNCIYS